MLTFFIFPQYCQTIIMDKGIGRVYKHSQCNWTFPPPNTVIVVPPRSVSSPQNDSTNYCSADMIAYNQPSPVSNPTNTDQVDTDFKNDGYTNYFATTIEQNHCTPEINDTITTTTQVQPNLYPHLLEHNHSTPTAPLKLNPSGNIIFVLKLTRKLPRQHSVTNHGHSLK